jgi:hypothetical protein
MIKLLQFFTKRRFNYIDAAVLMWAATEPWKWQAFVIVLVVLLISVVLEEYVRNKENADAVPSDV